MGTNGIIRVGMLGAARIGKLGLVDPARRVPGVAMYAVAARDPNRAAVYAKKYGVPRVHRSYDELLQDPDIDAIYNALPNSLHCEWTIKALAAGKHVLCEKPFSSNADEAVQMADAAKHHGRFLMEAFHYRFHPLTDRMREGVASLGKIHRIETNMCTPVFTTPGEIRWIYEMGGGATMDQGAYSTNLMLLLGQAAADGATRGLPTVVSATPALRSPTIDRAMIAEVRWDNGTVGRIHHSFWSSTLLKHSAHVYGEYGEMHVIDPFLPHLVNRLTLTVNGTTRKESISGETTYTYQLREFVNGIRKGEPYVSELSDSISTMQMIDAIYDRAGLPRRGLAQV